MDSRGAGRTKRPGRSARSTEAGSPLIPGVRRFSGSSSVGRNAVMVSLEPLGDRAFLAHFATERDAARWAAAVRALRPPGVTDVVLAYRSAAVFADPDRVELEDLETQLAAIEAGSGDLAEGKLVEIPVLYDGPDLEPAAAMLGLGRDEVVALHTADRIRRLRDRLPAGLPVRGVSPRRRSAAWRGATSPGSRSPPGRSPSPAVRRGSTRASLPADGTCWAGRRSASPIPTRDTSPSAPGTGSGSGPSTRPNSRTGAMSDSEPAGGTAPRSIDLNADLGEGCPNDRALLERVTSASICCGAHAGDPESIRATLRAARELGVVAGAHPGYRRPRRVRPARAVRSGRIEVERLILDQVADLRILADELGVPVRFLKPHGALYNQAQRQEEVARGVVAAACALGLPLLGQPGTLLESLARERDDPLHRRGFPRSPLPRRRLAGASRRARCGAPRPPRDRGPGRPARRRGAGRDALHSRRRARGGRRMRIASGSCWIATGSRTRSFLE